MNTRHGFKLLGARFLGKDATPMGVTGEPGSTGRNTNLFLVISHDHVFGHSLREAAEQTGLLLAHSAKTSGAVWQLRALRPGAVVLDLDLPSESAWEIADRLLELESCPPLILVTARMNQLDMATAVRAGTVVDKFGGPAFVLRLAAQASARYGIGQVERNSIQRVLVRWLRPCGWSVPVTPAHHFLGLND